MTVQHYFDDEKCTIPDFCNRCPWDLNSVDKFMWNIALFKHFCVYQPGMELIKRQVTGLFLIIAQTAWSGGAKDSINNRMIE